MRASRLLQMLMLLQNRGRLTSLALARELGVARRTILRDVDAIGEAGLPIVVHRGNRGGIELAFNYKTRLTGLARDEAEALGILLSRGHPELECIGLGDASRRARTKLIESLPDPVRTHAQRASRQFRIVANRAGAVDERIGALADAIRRSRVVRILLDDGSVRTLHPIALQLRSRSWSVFDAREPGRAIRLSKSEVINISAHSFAGN